MKFRRYAMAACVVGSLLALGGCNSDKSTQPASSGSMAVKADNTVCPVGGGAVVEGQTVAFGGKNVGFCCAGCKGKFEKMTDAQKGTAIAAMK